MHFHQRTSHDKVHQVEEDNILKFQHRIEIFYSKVVTWHIITYSLFYLPKNSSSLDEKLRETFSSIWLCKFSYFHAFLTSFRVLIPQKEEQVTWSPHDQTLKENGCWVETGVWHCLQICFKFKQWRKGEAIAIDELIRM